MNAFASQITKLNLALDSEILDSEARSPVNQDSYLLEPAGSLPFRTFVPLTVLVHKRARSEWDPPRRSPGVELPPDKQRGTATTTINCRAALRRSPKRTNSDHLCDTNASTNLDASILFSGNIYCCV